jgi:DNA-binding SARP family transcriptional activator
LVRIYLGGEVMVESGAALVREADLPGRQGRIALAHLVMTRDNPLAQADLAESVWPDRLASSWEVALSAIVSKLRVALARAGLPRSGSITSAFGCYQLHLPADTWVDIDAGRLGIHEAEAAIEAGDPSRAYGGALVAATVFRRPLLAGASGGWVDVQRRAWQSWLARALACMVEALRANGEYALALSNAEELIALDPFRESAYRQAMRLHVAGGDRASALRVYEACRERLRDELGVSPSAETEALQLELLRA